MRPWVRYEVRISKLKFCRTNEPRSLIFCTYIFSTHAKFFSFWGFPQNSTSDVEIFKALLCNLDPKNQYWPYQILVRSSKSRVQFKSVWFRIRTIFWSGGFVFESFPINLNSRFGSKKWFANHKFIFFSCVCFFVVFFDKLCIQYW